MRKHRLGLRLRLVLAMLLIVSISSAGFYYAVGQFIEFREGEILNRELAEKLYEFAHDPGWTASSKAGIRTFVASPQDINSLPARLRELPPGLHDAIFLDGNEYAAGREDVNGKRFYLLIDTTQVETLEAHFVSLAWACAIASWSAAILMALWLSNVVLRPVSRLAGMVAELEPTRRHSRLATQFDDREIGIIANAFDRFLSRLDDFVVREQAFTEDASHELRTPLTIMLNAAQLLEEEPHLSPIGHERLQRILRAAHQMQTLIEALLFLAREESGISTELVEVDKVAEDAAKAVNDMVMQKGVSLGVNTTPTQIIAPRGMVTCVINNLLLNAIHYTSKGRIDLLVESGCISVQDTGTGIPLQDIDRIFEHRYRGAQSHGQGLGLYLVKRICDRLGWTVKVSSAPGTGTRFDVLFSESLRKSNAPPTSH